MGFPRGAPARLLSITALGKGLQYRPSGFRISLRHRGSAMDLDAFDANELIHSVWELRQTALQLGESSGTKFLCPNCEQLKPFAGDKALGYYNNACGMVLVCND